MRRFLLDANLLIALSSEQHVHFPVVREWFKARGSRGFATCPFVQTALIRITTNPNFTFPPSTFSSAQAFLTELTRHPAHEFWPDDVSWGSAASTDWSLIRGHRQVTDAYLIALAANHNGCLATLDRAVLSLTSTPALVELVGNRSDNT